MVESIRIVDTACTDPYKNLALEEMLLARVGAKACILFLWQNRCTVVIGRNQNAWKECRVALLEQEGGLLARRRSGGGAVFHDLGNLNFSFLTCRNNYDLDRQTDIIRCALNAFGIAAEKKGRNDVTVEGRKISGNAFYSEGDRCCHHGTILINADTAMMSRYLSVSHEKLLSKGVDSVRARVANLTDFCPDASVEDVKAALIAAFSAEYALPAKPRPAKDFEGAKLDALSAKYADWKWRLGSPIPFTCEFSARFDWGEICLLLELQHGVVKTVNAFSDAMECDLITRIPAALAGLRFNSDALKGAVFSCAATPLEMRISTDIAGVFNGI